MPDSAHATPPPARAPLWRSKLLLAMTGVTIIGLSLWVYSLATRSAASSPAAGPAATSLASGFSAPSAQSAPPPEPRLVDQAAPAVARFGGCFIAGYCIAYAFRKMLKAAVLVTGVILIGLFLLQRAGLLQLNIDAITASLQHAADWIKGEAGALKDLVLGYLPSAGAGLTGMALGIRRK
ncbi:MAG: FUN14 domain-containing protein [Phycisphaerales bacterium]